MAAKLLSQLALQNQCANLAAENAQLQAVADTRNRLWQVSADLMLVAQFNGVIADANPAWTGMLGWTEQDLIGRNLFDLIHPDDIQQTIDGAKGLSVHGTTGRFEN